MISKGRRACAAKPSDLKLSAKLRSEQQEEAESEARMID
jgi:hypothetical protein